MGAPHFSYFVTESAYGTATLTPVLGTDALYLRLPEANALQITAEPVFQSVAYGGGLDIQAEAFADHYNATGTLSTLLYPSQAKLLLGWALSRVDQAATPHVPWVTSLIDGDLASASLYKAVTTPNSATVVRKRYPGCKVSSLELTCSRQQPKAMLKLGLVAQKEVGNPVDSSSDPDGTEFPAPADTDYPTGPYLFSHTSTNLKWQSTALVRYESFTLRVQNSLDPRFWENHWLDSARFMGRKISLDVSMLLRTTPALRTQLMNVTKDALQLKFDNGSNTATIDMKGKCYLSKLPEDLPLGKEFMLKATWTNMYDTSAGADLAVTTT